MFSVLQKIDADSILPFIYVVMYFWQLSKYD